MFPARYFNRRYFAARYWPKVGAAAPVFNPAWIGPVQIYGPTTPVTPVNA